MDVPKKDDRKKKKEERSHRPATRVLEPPAPKVSEQVPAGDDSDINEGRGPEEDKDVDRQIEPIDREQDEADRDDV